MKRGNVETTSAYESLAENTTGAVKVYFNTEGRANADQEAYEAYKKKVQRIQDAPSEAEKQAMEFRL